VAGTGHGEIVLGTDPEFVLVNSNTGMIRDPHAIIEDPDPHNRGGMAAGIGVDGDRATSSVELRPGISDSAEELVSRMAELLAQLYSHYHPPIIHYRAGAFVHPEPLGAHIHFGWDTTYSLYTQKYNDVQWKVIEIMAGIRAFSLKVTPELFNTTELQARAKYAINHNSDFSNPDSYRPRGGLMAVMNEKHLEYRHPPSWLNCPESAYVYLAAAESIAKEVWNTPVGTQRNWDKISLQMLQDEARSPKGPISIPKAFSVAKRYVQVPNFITNWVD